MTLFKYLSFLGMVFERKFNANFSLVFSWIFFHLLHQDELIPSNSIDGAIALIPNQVKQCQRQVNFSHSNIWAVFFIANEAVESRRSTSTSIFRHRNITRDQRTFFLHRTQRFLNTFSAPSDLTFHLKKNPILNTTNIISSCSQF